MIRSPRTIVLTGGPGAGKTATLEVIRRHFQHVVVLQEAAGIVFGGGFPRHTTDVGRRAGQRAIFHVQRELETLARDEHPGAVVLCDRGTLDALAYWPGSHDDFFRDTGTSMASELARYDMVVHLRTPKPGNGYNHDNPLRIESAREAARIDARIGEVWSGHPHLVVVDSCEHFVDKVQRVVALLRADLPSPKPSRPSTTA
jgi:predicted ATPase